MRATSRKSIAVFTIILEVDQVKRIPYDSFWNKDTKNKVRNPLLNNINRSTWNECYEVAQFVLSGQVTDPTFGATHFHSFKHQKDFPHWATKKNFKVKIDAVYFYELTS